MCYKFDRSVRRQSSISGYNKVGWNRCRALGVRGRPLDSWGSSWCTVVWEQSAYDTCNFLFPWGKFLQHSSESNDLAGVRTNLTKPHKPHIYRTGRHFCADCMVCAVLCGLCVRAVIITAFIYNRLNHTNHTKTHRTHKYNGRFLLRRVLQETACGDPGNPGGISPLLEKH